MTDDLARSKGRRSALDMPADEFRAVGHELIELIAGFYDSLDDRELTRPAAPDSVRASVGTDKLPEHGADAGSLFAEVAPILFDNSLHNGHPRFFGYITSSAAPVGALADLLAAAVNANVVKWELSPVASEIEAQTIRWVADLIGYEPDSSGLMVSGGNMANFLAFVAARYAKAPWDIRKTGNYGDERHLTAYVSAEAHTWIDKATDVCGLGADAIRWVAVDDQGRMRLDRLREQIEADRNNGCIPFFAVGTAGSVSTGAIDPLRDMAELCREHDVWFHIDGAYGAPAAVLPEAPDDLHALSLADSVAVDPHKWLYCPIEAACVLTKHQDALHNAFSFQPDYYRVDKKQATGTDYYQLGMQNSRGFRALKVWLALRNAGRKGYCESIRGDIRLAERLFETVAASPEFEACRISLSIATFRYIPQDIDRENESVETYLNELNQSLLAELQAGGQLFLSNAIIGDTYYLRACIVNFRTMIEDVAAIPLIVAELGGRLDKAMRPDHLVT